MFGGPSNLPGSLVASPAGLTESPTSIRSELLDNLAGSPSHSPHLPSGKMRELSVRDHRVPGARDSNSDLQVAMAGLDLADISADGSNEKTHYGWSDWQNLASASQKRTEARASSAAGPAARPATSSPQPREVVWSFYGPRGPGDRPSRMRLPGLKLESSTRLVEISKVMTNNVHRIFYWEMTVENRTGTTFNTMRWDGTIPKGVQQPLLGELEKESKELTRMQEVSDPPNITSCTRSWQPFDLLMLRRKRTLRSKHAPLKAKCLTGMRTPFTRESHRPMTHRVM